MPRHFLTGTELDGAQLRALIERALELKAAPRSSRALHERCVGLVFEKPSTRTRRSPSAGESRMARIAGGVRTWLQNTVKFDSRFIWASRMASAVAGCAGDGCAIVSAETVESSYPNFFDDLERLA